MASSTDDDDCIGYARECVRLAGLTQDPELRDQLLNMAREWMATAMHEAKGPTPARSAHRLASPSRRTDRTGIFCTR
jgi:hypothetical protein